MDDLWLNVGPEEIGIFTEASPFYRYLESGLGLSETLNA
jgi:hypothetical protein